MHPLQLLKSTKELALAFVFGLVSYGGSADPFTTPAPVSIPGVGMNGPGAVAELLDPDRAFQPQIRLRDVGTAEVKFDVVPGYYLYRDRIRIEGFGAPPTATGRKVKPGTGASNGATATASNKGAMLALVLPHGQMVDDPTFGRVEIFDKSVTFTVDLNLASGAANAAKAGGAKLATKFVVTSQGCAKAGVCFPPQQHEFALPATVSKSRDAASAAWVPPIGVATSLGFGRPKSVAEQTSATK
jgi:thiol:disulfide interchange protein DsbD